jgi:hypothetical protein
VPTPSWVTERELHHKCGRPTSRSSLTPAPFQRNLRPTRKYLRQGYANAPGVRRGTLEAGFENGSSARGVDALMADRTADRVFETLASAQGVQRPAPCRIAESRDVARGPGPGPTPRHRPRARRERTSPWSGCRIGAGLSRRTSKSPRGSTGGCPRSAPCSARWRGPRPAHGAAGRRQRLQRSGAAGAGGMTGDKPTPAGGLVRSRRSAGAICDLRANICDMDANAPGARRSSFGRTIRSPHVLRVPR